MKRDSTALSHPPFPSPYTGKRRKVPSPCLERGYRDEVTEWRKIVCISLLLILAACSPPQTPEQLNFTPGAPITITDDLYVTSAFSVRYPPGWRVITPPAEAPPGAIFAAPDNTALIVLSISPIGTPPELANVPAERVAVEGDEVVLGKITVHAALVADRDVIDTLRDDFEVVIDSIKRE